MRRLEWQACSIVAKTLHGSYDAEQGRHVVHLVRARVDECSVSVGQMFCTKKSHEIEDIPHLLAALYLQGTTVTISAMATQSVIA